MFLLLHTHICQTSDKYHHSKLQDTLLLTEAGSEACRFDLFKPRYFPQYSFNVYFNM